MSSSARVPVTPVPIAPLAKKKCGSKSARRSSLEEDVVGEDDDDGEEEAVTRRKGSMALEQNTLFVDGISDLVGYSQIKDLFSQIGRVSKVFVQRFRKVGRKYRFGFVHFQSTGLAEAAMARLNGTKVGGTHLSVTEARFPLRRGSSSQVHNLEVLPSTQRKMSSGLQNRVDKGDGFAPPSLSWQDVVAGKVGERRERVLFQDEDCMFGRTWRCCEERSRLSDVSLFPKLEFEGCVCWFGGKQGELGLLSDDHVLFPECAFEKPRLERQVQHNGEAHVGDGDDHVIPASTLGELGLLSPSLQRVVQQNLSFLFEGFELCRIARFAIPLVFGGEWLFSFLRDGFQEWLRHLMANGFTSSVSVGPNILPSDFGWRCPVDLAHERRLQALCVKAIEPAKTSSRWGRPKKVLRGSSVCVGDPGEGVVRGCSPAEKIFCPRG